MTTETMTMIAKHRPPTHAGEILLEEFLKPLNLTQVQAVNLQNAFDLYEARDEISA